MSFLTEIVWTMLLACLVVAYGSIRAAASYIYWKKELNLSDTDESALAAFSFLRAAVYSILLTIGLVVIVHIFPQAATLVIGLIVITYICAFFYAFHPLLIHSTTMTIIVNGLELRVSNILLAILTASAIYYWISVGGFSITNVLAVCMALLINSVITIPNLKGASLVFLVVLFSDFIRHVIVPILSKPTMMFEIDRLPASFFHRLPSLSSSLDAISSELGGISFPTQLVIGDSALDLLRLVVPGLVVSYVTKYDKEVLGRYKYIAIAMGGYAVGLATAIILSHAATALGILQCRQPILTCIVAFTILPIVLVSLRAGDFGLLWNGFRAEIPSLPSSFSDFSYSSQPSTPVPSGSSLNLGADDDASSGIIISIDQNSSSVVI